MIKRALRYLMLCTATSLSVLALTTFAQTNAFPSKPINLIVPFSPGGALDNIARALADTLKNHLDASIIVENRPGGNYMVGTRALLQSAADGHTLMLTTNGMMSITPVLYANTAFDPIKDFTHIGLVSTYPYVIVAGKNRYPNLQTVIQQAQSKPEGLSIAFTGHVTSLSADFFASLIHTQVVKVPYKGDPDAISDLASGRVDIGMFGPSVAVPLVLGGKLDGLAVTTAQRLSTLPHIPTTEESALAEFKVSVWTALIAPAGIPESAREVLQTALGKALQDPKFLNHLARTGDVTLPGDSEAFRKRIRNEQTLWKNVMEVSGTKPIQS